MKLKFASSEDQDKIKLEKMVQLLTTHRAVIFSRVGRECVAIVSSACYHDNRKHWVWLSGGLASGQGDGAYTDGDARAVESIARTLVFGEWVYQPDAYMVLQK